MFTNLFIVSFADPSPFVVPALPKSNKTTSNSQPSIATPIPTERFTSDETLITTALSPVSPLPDEDDSMSSSSSESGNDSYVTVRRRISARPPLIGSTMSASVQSPADLTCAECNVILNKNNVANNRIYICCECYMQLPPVNNTVDKGIGTSEEDFCTEPEKNIVQEIEQQKEPTQEDV